MSHKSLKNYEEQKIEDNAYSLFNFDFHFYPPIKKFNDFGCQYEIYNNEKNGPKFLNNGMIKEIKSDLEEDLYVINKDFFDSLLGKNNQSLSKDKKIKTISKIIRKSKLMEKLEKESKGSDKKIDLCMLSNMCAKNLSFMELKKGKILFKIGDNGDRFYFILSGKITILKPRQILAKMNLQEYISYLFLLIKEKEDYLFNEVVHINCTQIPITSVEEVKNLYKLFFIMNLKLNLDNGNISNNINLKNYFDMNYQSFNEYNLDIQDLEILEYKKQKIPGNKLWNNYIINNCNMSRGDLRFIGRYKEYDEKNNILCYVYDSFLYLGPGFFFGDSALEEKKNKRNATIRAEEDSVLGFLKSVDYSNMIAPQRKIEKMKQINFLISNFFFKNINTSVFEKELFHYFTLNESSRGTILFDCDSLPKYLYFLKEGNLSVNLKCSIIDINNIIEKIFKKVISKYGDEIIQKKITTRETINKLKAYSDNNNFLGKLKQYTKEFIKEINKKRTLQIAVYNGPDTIGLEEIFLEIPYISQVIVTTEKIIYYKLETINIKKILIENHHINYFYIKSSINKIFSLIERLHNLKQNYIDIAKMRYENHNSFRNKNLPTLKNINISISNNNDQHSNLMLNSPISKLSRNIGSEFKTKEKEFKIFSYSENKINKQIKKDTSDEQGNDDIYNNILNYKSPLFQNPYMNNNIFQTILLDTKLGNKNSSYDKNTKFNSKKNSIINNNIIISDNNYTKFSDYVKGLNKPKNNIINVKINNNKYNEETDKYSEIITNNNNYNIREESDVNNKSIDLIKIGDRSLTLDRLKRKIRKSDYQIYKSRKKLLKIIQSNNYYLENQKNTNDNNISNESENNQNTFKKDIRQINMKPVKSSIIRKSQDINNFHLSFLPLNVNEEEDIKIKKMNTNNDKHKDNISLRIIKSNTSKNLKKISKKNMILYKNNSFDYKNKKNIQKNFQNNKCLSKKTIFNKNNKNLFKDDSINHSHRKYNVNKVGFSFNDNDKKKLPTIILKRINVNNTNEFMNGKYFNHKEFMPEIVKNFYDDKKMKGYASLIPHKESNTLFLRKYHKKYNNKNLESNSNNKECK